MSKIKSGTKLYIVETDKGILGTTKEFLNQEKALKFANKELLLGREVKLKVVFREKDF